MSDPRSFALLALIGLAFAGWHLRPTIAAAWSAWRTSRHPNQLGPLQRADVYRRSRP